MVLFKNKQKDNNEEQNKELVSKILKMYKDAYNSKANLHALWDKCYKAYKGELFKKALPDYKAQVLDNMIFSTIETIIPILFSANPRFLVFPQIPEMFDRAQMIQNLLDFEFDRARVFQTMIQGIKTGVITGTSPFAVVWDQNASNGLGEVKLIPISPFNFFVDPLATNLDDAEYVIYATYKNVGEIIKQFPDKQEEILKSAKRPDDEYLMYGRNVDMSNVNNVVLYVECYMKDYSVDKEIIEEEGKKYEVSQKKYPNGRRVIIAGDTLLYDGENPYKNGKFPFVVWKCYETPNSFWGTGEVENIIEPQKYRIEILNCIIENARTTANSVWILDKNCGVDYNTITGRPGLVIRKNPGTEVRRESPQPLPAYIQNLPALFAQDIENISGVYDVTRGEKPLGVTAAAAITALQEQAQGRIKLKVQLLEEALAEIGSLWIAHVQQFWETKRYISFVNEQTDTREFVAISKHDIDGDFTIKVKAGSTMPVNKTSRLQQLIQMAQTMAEDGLPLVDRKTILENADIPDVNEILEKFEMIKQEQQQMALQQQQNAIQSQLEGQVNGQATQEEVMQQPNELEGQVAQLLQEIGRMSPEELTEFIKQNPEVEEILKQLSTEQP